MSALGGGGMRIVRRKEGGSSFFRPRSLLLFIHDGQSSDHQRVSTTTSSTRLLPRTKPAPGHRGWLYAVAWQVHLASDGVGKSEDAAVVSFLLVRVVQPAKTHAP